MKDSTTDAAFTAPDPGGQKHQGVGASPPSPSSWPPFLVGQPEQPVRVLLIDDDPHARRVIAQELLADPRIHLAGQASTAREGRHLIARQGFEVMLVDLNLSDGNGFELIDVMKSTRPMAEAVVITALEDEDHAIRAFERGATGYLIKNSWFDSFPQAVLQVVNGGASITPNLARRLLRRLASQPTHPADTHAIGAGAGARGERLSERECEVLRLVASGHVSGEIGKRLCISGLTVDAHVRNIYRKLHVRTRAQAVNRASQWGLL